MRSCISAIPKGLVFRAPTFYILVEQPRISNARPWRPWLSEQVKPFLVHTTFIFGHMLDQIHIHLKDDKLLKNREAKILEDPHLLDVQWIASQWSSTLNGGW